MDSIYMKYTDCQGMTVGQLIEILQSYPSESPVFISRYEIDGRIHPSIEIKEVTPVFDQDADRASPCFSLGEVKFIAKSL